MFFSDQEPSLVLSASITNKKKVLKILNKYGLKNYSSITNKKKGFQEQKKIQGNNN